MNNNKVVVTCRAWFIGSILSKYLSAENQVFIIYNLSTAHIDNIKDLTETKVKELLKVLKDFNCKIYRYTLFLKKDTIKIFCLELIKKIKVEHLIIAVINGIFKKTWLEGLNKIIDNKIFINRYAETFQ